MSRITPIRALLGVVIVSMVSLLFWKIPESARSQTDPILIREKMRTPDWPGAEIDSVAVWKGSEGEAWLFATGKTSNLIYVCDASTGDLLRTLGDQDHPLSRPNGILVVGKVLYVVERDNPLVRVFALPGLTIIGTFGADSLVSPYGITALDKGSHHQVFVTDNYDPVDPQGNRRSMDERIKRYRVEVAGDTLQATRELSFGTEEGTGDLVEVETILAHPTEDRVYVCDEPGRVVHVYDSQGAVRDEPIGKETILYEPEGMVFVESTSLHPKGVLVVTDQGEEQTVLRVYTPDGERLIGSFSGDPNLANTDGICFIPGDFGPFEKGALFCVHNDLRVQGYSWADVEQGLMTASLKN